jgi:predicted nucleotidyltransferase
MKHLKEYQDFPVGKIHTREQAEMVLSLIRDNIDDSATLIGGFGKGKNTSYHDIDILIPDGDQIEGIENSISSILNAESSEPTDWGGIYFNNTDFGDVDVFFTTKDFDY